jgi:hypothetical protein
VYVVSFYSEYKYRKDKNMIKHNIPLFEVPGDEIKEYVSNGRYIFISKEQLEFLLSNEMMI